MARPTPAFQARDTLLQLVHVIDEGLAGRGWGEQPTVLIHATVPDTEGTFDVGVKEIDEHPALALLGAAAPDDWVAIGASQLGWMRPLDALTGSIGRSSGLRRRVRVTTLMSRTAGSATVVRGADDAAGEEMPDGAVGRIPDVLCRCLHLPTPPPDVAVTMFFAAVWLGAIHQAGEGSSRPLSWRQVRALHPGHRPDSPLAVAAADQAAGIGWDGVRWQTVEGQWDVPGVSPELAAWFDDGSFARWVQPAPDDLTAIAHLVTDQALRQIATTLGALGAW